ncbi:MAG: hypothetical protein IPM84_08335 [Anaerolineae bacterium]|nr:hypothetical protein [Anaerolineae bacterium]
MIWADYLSPCLGSVSGISRNVSDPYFANGATDFIVSLGGWSGGGGTDYEKIGTFMHELGHNLGLKHGGEDHINYKPNFLSIMSYTFQTSGLIRDGGYGTFDYSRWTLPQLDENSLNETQGLNGGSAIATYGTVWYCRELVGFSLHETANANGPIDWNCDDDSTDTGLSADINQDDQKRLLTTQDDWSIISFSGNGVIGNTSFRSMSIADREKLIPTITTYTDELTWERDRKLRTPRD